jgi:hypothetical protein
MVLNKLYNWRFVNRQNCSGNPPLISPFDKGGRKGDLITVMVDLYEYYT